MKNRYKGPLFVIASGAAFSSMGALIKLASTGLPNEVIVFFRNVFGLLFLIPYFLRSKDATLRTAVLPLHIARGVIGFGAMFTFFYAIALIPLSEAVLLSYTTPLFAPLIAFIWLKESVSLRTKLAIAIGFLGVVFILRPTTDLSLVEWGAIVALASGLLAALALTIVRRLSVSEPASRIVFYHTTVACLVSALPASWVWETPGLAQIGWLAAIGLLATLGQLAITRGYALAPVATAGPFTYSTVVFAGLYGWLFWEELPDWLTFMGILLVVVAGVMALAHEPKQERNKAV